LLVDKGLEGVGQGYVHRGHRCILGILAKFGKVERLQAQRQ
jgi:hypothetical protein